MVYIRRARLGRRPETCITCMPPRILTKVISKVTKMRFSATSLTAGLLLGVVAGTLVTNSVMSRYYVNGKPGSFIRVDRFTGDLQHCDFSTCDPITIKDKPAWYGSGVDYAKTR
jgi:hypothetical protein